MKNIVRSNGPLVLNITNVVTINDVANILTYIGASPMMTNSKDEVIELLDIVKMCNGSLVINIGTVDSIQAELMFEAVKIANEIGVKVVLDPVGAGASLMRTNIAKELLQNYHIEVVRGNYNEISALIDIEIDSKGVDSIKGEDISVATKFANEYQTIVLISGEVDYLSDGKTTEAISGGSHYLPQISGTGCMLTSIVGAYVAASDNSLEATKAALLHVLDASEAAANNADSIIQFKHNWFKQMELVSYE